MSRNIKTVIVYIGTSIFAFVIYKIYSLFSHGVSSKTMASMWIWLMCFGAVFYLLLELICKKTKTTANRLSSNIYNSGLAVLVTGMLLHGILEIAGTGSQFLLFYTITGILLMITGVGLLLFFLIHRHKDI